jgi:hypothetical protein
MIPGIESRFLSQLEILLPPIIQPCLVTPAPPRILMNVVFLRHSHKDDMCGNANAEEMPPMDKKDLE